MYEKIIEFINERTDGDLVMLCNQIFDWRTTGNFLDESLLYKISQDFSDRNFDYVVDLILKRATERLEKVVLLLFKENPSNFLKNVGIK